MTPKLIALVDVLFVLLAFLMLGGDLRPRAEEDVRLPKASCLIECMGFRCKDPLIVNAYHRPEVECGRYRRSTLCRDEDHWRLSLAGRDYSTSRALRRAMDSTRHRVELRADATAPYGLVQTALAACGEAGIQSVLVSAARPPCPR